LIEKDKMFQCTNKHDIWILYAKVIKGQSFSGRGLESFLPHRYIYIYIGDVQWGPNQNGVFEIAVKEISMLPTLTASQELKNWYFTTKCLPQHHLYVSNMYTKFQGQKIHQKKVIQNLSTWVVVEKISLLPTLTDFHGLKK